MAEQIELRAAQKKKFFDEGMVGDHVLVHFDARKGGVQVPVHLAGNPALTLKLSYLFQGETKADEQGVTSYLKFSGDYYQCVIPWDAVWGITTWDQKNRVWPEEVPREVVLQLVKTKIVEGGKKFFGRASKPAPAADGDAEAQPEKPKKNGKGHLTRIK